MNEKSAFLKRPISFAGESLTSLILRTAELNHTRPHVIWRHALPPRAHYPQSQISSLINCVPDSIFDTSVFSRLVGLDREQLENLTFTPVIRKFFRNETPIEDMSSQRVTSGLIIKSLRYCPLCLNEKPYYRLIWQVQELNVCLEHGVYLIENCPSCNKALPQLAANGVIGFCPHCETSLYSTVAKNTIINTLHIRIFQDWSYLLNQLCSPLAITTTLDSKQFLAIKVLFIATDKQKIFSWKNKNDGTLNISTISSLLQTCRGTSSTMRHTHLNTLFTVIREKEMPLDEFANLSAPETFIESVLKQDSPLKELYSCQAPWCPSYGQPGSLSRTATSTKRKKDGTHLNYYLFCKECGIEYAIDSSSKGILERGYYIELGWNKVKRLAEEGYSKREISRLLGVPEDKVLRCLIFLIANTLITPENYNFELPKKPKAEIINEFMKLIQTGDKVKQIRKTLKLSYSEFLYYWSLPEVKIFWLKTTIPASRVYKKDWVTQLPIVNKILLKHPEPITIKRVSQMLSIHPESLRLQGLLPEIAEAKKKQKEILQNERSVILKTQADEAIKKLKENNLQTTSEAVYKILGIGRTVLVRTHPEVTAYISKILKAAKSNI